MNHHKNSSSFDSLNSKLLSFPSPSVFGVLGNWTFNASSSKLCSLAGYDRKPDRIVFQHPLTSFNPFFLPVPRPARLSDLCLSKLHRCLYATSLGLENTMDRGKSWINIKKFCVFFGFDKVALKISCAITEWNICAVCCNLRTISLKYWDKFGRDRIWSCEFFYISNTPDISQKHKKKHLAIQVSPQ